MATEPDKRKGFAGLEEMTSEVEVPVFTPRPATAKPAQSTASDPVVNPTRGRPFQIDASRLQPPKPKGMSSQKKWLIGIGIFVGIVIIANLSDKKSGGGYSAPAVYEEIPPPGSGQLLSDNQIRYCLSQDIRLSSYDSAVNHYSQSAIDSFNAAVADYNSRCSNYKYRRGSLDRIRNEVESRRSELQSDGLSRAALLR